MQPNQGVGVHRPPPPRDPNHHKLPALQTHHQFQSMHRTLPDYIPPHPLPNWRTHKHSATIHKAKRRFNTLETCIYCGAQRTTMQRNDTQTTSAWFRPSQKFIQLHLQSLPHHILPQATLHLQNLQLIPK